MRKLILLLAMAVCGTMQLVAQQPPPHPPLADLLLPHSHARPVPANPQHTPEVIFDATSLGSPLLLDKGWRVGITSNPAAATAEFDDSTWAVRDAQESFAEVPDEDHPAGALNGDNNTGRSKGHQRPFAWFRLHVKLPPNHGSLVLIIESAALRECFHQSGDVERGCLRQWPPDSP